MDIEAGVSKASVTLEPVCLKFTFLKVTPPLSSVKINQTIPKILLCLLPVYFLTLVTGAFGNVRQPTGQQSTEMAQLRAAGIQGDRSRINALITIVRNPYATNSNTYGPSINELMVMTALRALSRLRATEAIPDIDTLARQTAVKYPNLSNFAVVQRARLQAEESVTNAVGDRAKTSDRIKAFYQALGLTPGDINARAKLYKQQFYADANGQYLPHPVEVYAMREIADLIYHGSYEETTTMPDVLSLDFSLDAPAQLKMRLAPFIKSERAGKLVDRIVTGKCSPETQDYELQLLVDEGKLASNAIARSLLALETQPESEQKREKRKSLAGFFRELSAIGDKDQMSLLKHYLTDPDPTIQEEAKLAAQRIEAGDRSIFPRAADF